MQCWTLRCFAGLDRTFIGFTPWFGRLCWWVQELCICCHVIDLYWLRTLSPDIPLPKSVVVHGFIAGADGRKMPPPWDNQWIKCDLSEKEGRCFHLKGAFRKGPKHLPVSSFSPYFHARILSGYIGIARSKSLGNVVDPHDMLGPHRPRQPWYMSRIVTLYEAR